MGVHTRDFVSLRSKRFRAVSEQRTRNESQRVREFFFHFFRSRSIFSRGRNRNSLGLSLLRNQTETLATQANELLARWS